MVALEPGSGMSHSSPENIDFAGTAQQVFEWGG